MTKTLSKLLTLLLKAVSFLACAAVGYYIASTWNQPLWTTGSLILWAAPIAGGLSAAYFLHTLADQTNSKPPRSSTSCCTTSRAENTRPEPPSSQETSEDPAFTVPVSSSIHSRPASIPDDITGRCHRQS